MAAEEGASTAPSRPRRAELRAEAVVAEASGARAATAAAVQHGGTAGRLQGAAPEPGADVPPSTSTSTATSGTRRAEQVPAVLRRRGRPAPAGEDDRWGAYARRLLDDGAWSRPRRGTRRRPPAHHADGALRRRRAAGRLYELVARRFLAAVSRTRAAGPAWPLHAGPRAGLHLLREVSSSRTPRGAPERRNEPRLQPRRGAPGGGRRGPAPVEPCRERQTRPPTALEAVRRAHGEARHRRTRRSRRTSRTSRATTSRSTPAGASGRPPWACPRARLRRRRRGARAARRARADREAVRRRGARRRAAGPRRRARDPNVRGQVRLLHQQPRRRRGPLRRGLRRAARGRQGRAALRPRRADGAVPARGPAPLAPATKGSCSCPRRAVASRNRARCPACRSGCCAARRDGPGASRTDVAYPLCARCSTSWRRRRASGGALAALHAAAERGAAPPPLCLGARCPTATRRSARSSRATHATSGGAARGPPVRAGRAGARARPRIVSTRPQSSWAPSASVAGVGIAGVTCAYIAKGGPLDQARALARGRRPTPSTPRAKRTTLAPPVGRGRGRGWGGAAA